MNPKDRDIQDHELEQDLAELRRHYASPFDEKPPELVDQAVLNMARRALEPDEGQIGSRWSLFTSAIPAPRWLGGIATAAVVVLAVTLLLEQGGITPESPPVPSFKLDQALDSLQESDATTGARRESSLDEARGLDEAESLRDEVGPDRHGAYSLEEAPERDMKQTREPVLGGRFQDGNERNDVPAPSEEPALEAQTEYFRNAQDPGSGEQSETGASALPPPPAMTNEAPAFETEADALLDNRQRKLEGMDEDLSYREDPEAWISRLSELLESGETAQLANEVAAFRARYPEYPLPESLEAFAPSS